MQPPPNSQVRVSRAGDTVIFSGTSTNRSDAIRRNQLGDFENSTMARAVPIAVRVFRYIAIALFALPVLVTVPVLAFAPGRKVPPEFIAALVGFFALWSGFAWLFLRGLRIIPLAERRLSAQPWELKVSPTEVLTSQRRMLASEDYDACNPKEISRIAVNTDGYIVAELNAPPQGVPTEIVLTGALNQTDAHWLQSALTELLETQQHSSDAITLIGAGHLDVPPNHLPDGFTQATDPLTGNLNITFRIGIGQRLFGAFLMTLFATGFGAMALKFSGKRLNELNQFPFDSWWPAFVILVGAGFVTYFAWNSINILFGSTVFKASTDTLIVIRKTGFFGRRLNINRNDLLHFRRFTEKSYDSDDSGSPLYGLVAMGTKEVTLLSRDTFEQCDWLGQTLSKWYDVPFRHSR